LTARPAPAVARAVIAKAQTRSKVPLALVGILSMPLFFSALMAMSLAVETPTVHHLLKHGKPIIELGDPSGANETAVWLLALATIAVVMAAGVVGIFAGRAGVPLAAVTAIAAAVVMLVPLGGWADRHTGRYPDGVDLIPRSSTDDIYLRGEWESSARTTAQQLALVTLAMGGFAIAVLLALELRRRRRGTAPAPPPPPPPPVVEGGPHVVGDRLAPLGTGREG
jgi:hypothetical protein